MKLLRGFYAWIKTLPPPLQQLYFVLEAGVVTGLAAFLYNVLNTWVFGPHGLSGYPWGSQIHDLKIAVFGAFLKALFDLSKGYTPVQLSPAAAAAPQNGP